MSETVSGPKRETRSVIVGQRAFAALSTVEGLKLTPAGRKRVAGKASVEQRRAEVLRAYSNRKATR